MNKKITDFARELEQELGDSVVDFGAMGIAPGLEEAPEELPGFQADSAKVASSPTANLKLQGFPPQIAGQEG